MTKERITIMIPIEKLIKLRRIQSKVIAETSKTYSLSKCIEDHLVLRSNKKNESK